MRGSATHEHTMRASQPWKTNRARALRSRATSAETRLWHRLRNRQINGYKFVRQAPIGPYFADFLCRETMLIIEIDGGTHGTDSEIASDETRSKALEALGYRIFRVWNGDVLDNLDATLDAIVRRLEEG